MTKINKKAAEFLSKRESNVRFYSRNFNVEFDSGHDTFICSSDGRQWLDFFSAAGSLNYGHNPKEAKNALLDYINRQGITTSLDMFTLAKREFVESFDKHILLKRDLDYKYQFCGPTGTNAVEAAIKLARKATSRNHIIAFSNSFHGMTEGSLSISASKISKNRSDGKFKDVTFLTFNSENNNDIAMLTKSGLIPKPACVIVELIQGEGGINVANTKWIKKISETCKEIGALLIVDDIQMGCGRTGSFFSFEHYGLKPDIVCLSKSLSGFGLPMSLLLIKPEYDCWNPGEHNGTFRGFNYAFVTAKVTIDNYWAKDTFLRNLKSTESVFRKKLKTLGIDHPNTIRTIRTLGFVAGIEVFCHANAQFIVKEGFRRGIILEACGPDNSVIKLLPAITMTVQQIEAGFLILHDIFSSIKNYAR